MQHAYSWAPWSSRCHLCSMQGSWDCYGFMVLTENVAVWLHLNSWRWSGLFQGLRDESQWQKNTYSFGRWFRSCTSGSYPTPWLCNCPQPVGTCMYFSWVCGVSKEILHMSDSLYFTPLRTLIVQIQQFSASGQRLSWGGKQHRCIWSSWYLVPCQNAALFIFLSPYMFVFMVSSLYKDSNHPCNEELMDVTCKVTHA